MQETNYTTRARDVENKFEFYLLALVFTILGFSLQTSVFTDGWFQPSLEILSFLSLLLSGLIGISRLELKPDYYDKISLVQKYVNDLNKLKNDSYEITQKLIKLYESFMPDPIKVEDLKQQQKIIEQKKEPLVKWLNEYPENILADHKKIDSKFNIHKLLFASGLTFLVFSRILFQVTQ